MVEGKEIVFINGPCVSMINRVSNNEYDLIVKGRVWQMVKPKQIFISATGVTIEDYETCRYVWRGQYDAQQRLVMEELS